MDQNNINNVKVSVCVSVYNTAKYLPRCLDSLCNQTLNSLEIVLVNNGSTDNSEDIMHQYAKEHPERKFIIIAQKDLGLAQGRQTGINNATGEYIAVLDADDYVEKTMYEKMYEAAIQHKVDIVEVETIRNGKVITSPFSGYQDARVVYEHYMTKGGIPSMLWMRLYHRSLFNKPVLPTIYTNNEDVFAFPCLLYRAISIYYIKEPLHTYSTDNEQGVMHLLNTDPSMIDKRYNNAAKALTLIDHLKKYIGDNLDEEILLINCLSASKICTFIFTDYKGKGIDEKIATICQTMHFDDYNDLSKYVSRNLKFQFNKYGIIKLFGIKLTYKILFK